MPRTHDVRRQRDRQPRPRGLDPHHPQGPRRRDQLRRHRGRVLRRRVRGDRRQGAEGAPRRRRAGHQVRAARWATTPTSRAIRGAGSCPRSRTRCAGCGTDHIDLYQVHRPDPTPTSRRRSRRSRTWSAAARSGRSAPRRCPPPRSSRRSGSPSAAGWSGSAPSSRRTRSSTAASSARCCRPASATAWACWSGARSARACSPAASARARQTDLRARRGSSSTSPTSASLDAVEQLIPLAERRACR